MDSNRKSKLRFVLVCLINLVCLIAGLVQSYEVVSRYLEYPVKVSTTLASASHKQLPAISVCVGYQAMISKLQSQLPQIYSKYGDLKKTSHLDQWDEILTVKQYGDVSVSRLETIIDCYVQNRTNVTKCTDWNSPVFMNYDYKCFSNLDIGEQIRHRVDKSFRVEDISNSNWVAINIRAEERAKYFAEYLAIGLHNRTKETSPDMGSRAFYEFKFSKNMRIAFTYSTLSTILLPSPYGTKCVHYEQDGRPTYRNKLVSQCAAESFFSRTARWPRDLFYIASPRYEGAKFAPLEPNRFQL
ncbi:hypothetical protein HDE_03923 [Halotydeus destructor]|nr:hypothetical protein HDE_03923 [Halotydeus destructor]